MSRSPRNVRHIVLANRQENDDCLRDKVDTLRSLAHDDRQESEMLRSRVDQQSELIAILKQRADQNQERCESLSKRIIDLDEERESFELEASRERRQREIVERRFSHLNENHVKMISIKDDYKAENVTLRRDNERLKRENESHFNEIVRQRDCQLSEMQSRLSGLEERCGQLDAKRRKVEEEAEESQRLSVERIRNLECELIETKRILDQRHEELVEKTKQSDCELEARDTAIKQFQRDRDELTVLAMERGRTIEEHQQLVARLQEEKEVLTKTLESAEKRFQSEAGKVSKDVRVRELTDTVTRLERRLGEMRREHEAYKKYSTELLTRERALNETLRHVDFK